jgi:translation initiation factor 2B subunit (eIF-2B alpha/beta/delta family)
MSIREILIETVAAGVGAVVKMLLDENPSTAEKVAAGKRIAFAALDLIPEEEIHAFLTDVGREHAERVFETARGAKLND